METTLARCTCLIGSCYWCILWLIVPANSSANHLNTEAKESMCRTCSSGRDKSSIQACSTSGEDACIGVGGDSGPGERVAGGRAGCSGDIMGTTAGSSRQMELCKTNIRIWSLLYSYILIKCLIRYWSIHLSNNIITITSLQVLLVKAAGCDVTGVVRMK